MHPATTVCTHAHTRGRALCLCRSRALSASRTHACALSPPLALSFSHTLTLCVAVCFTVSLSVFVRVCASLPFSLHPPPSSRARGIPRSPALSLLRAGPAGSNTTYVTLPQHFLENGYYTTSAGKIFHSYNRIGAGQPINGDYPFSWSVPPTDHGKNGCDNSSTVRRGAAACLYLLTFKVECKLARW